jgi:hypothetical protein
MSYILWPYSLINSQIGRFTRDALMLPSATLNAKNTSWLVTIRVRASNQISGSRVSVHPISRMKTAWTSSVYKSSAITSIRSSRM